MGAIMHGAMEFCEIEEETGPRHIHDVSAIYLHMLGGESGWFYMPFCFGLSF